ncbi:MAG: septum formation inhibitor Maf [Myxococcota bacterium]
MVRFTIMAVGLSGWLFGCTPSPPKGEDAPAASTEGFLPSPESFAEEYPTFDKYWYQGRAELTRYALKQHRYGDTHDGDAVLVFVTEPFLPGLQVKQEHGDAKDSVSVLKLNAYRRFYTGIYPYTVMTSSFTPAHRAGAPTLKVTNTVQEWCGQTFTQVNRRASGLQLSSYSYKQDEGDRKLKLADAKLEDGLWAQIRIDPTTIVEGEQELVPGLDYLVMRHKALRAYPAIVKRTEGATTELVAGTFDSVEIEYPPLGRTLTIFYEAEFPFAIVAWDESVGPQRTTAVRTNAIIDDYWNHAAPGDVAYRESLGVEF